MLTNLFDPIATGSSTQVRGLSRALASLGHRVVVITPRIDDETPEYEELDGFKVYRIPAVRLPRMSISLYFPWLNWTFWPKNVRRVEAILKENKIDVVHVHNHMFDLAFTGVLMKRRLGLPLVLTIHTMIKHSIRPFNLILYPADRLFLRHAVVRHADVVVCPDRNMEAYVETAFKRSDGKMIPYGISLPPHPGAAAQRRIVEHFGLAGRRIILSLGHVHALRNRLDLIAAIPEVRSRFPDVLLLIVGTVGDSRPVDLVNRLGLKDAVMFVGAQPHQDAPVFHGLAEFEAMWLDQAEAGMNSLGIACMEAMLCGKPVITVSNVDTFGAGVLANGRDVLIVEPGDHRALSHTIIDLLEHPEKARSIGAAAEKVAKQNFSWSTVAAETSRTYLELAKAKMQTV